MRVGARVFELDVATGKAGDQSALCFVLMKPEVTVSLVLT